MSTKFVHRLELATRPGYIFQTNSFYKGDNKNWKPIDHSLSGHLKYSFQSPLGSCISQIYGHAYQGIGTAFYHISNAEEIGYPTAIYLFQGARIAQLSSRFSLNYEWNFGISFGWRPYDPYDNNANIAIGSKANAYINANVYFNYMISRWFDFNCGVALTHFSNGNTKFPNAGLNTVGPHVGLVYYFNRETNQPEMKQPVPEFPHHISYDLVLFGSWRRKGVENGDSFVASPNAYTVLGFNFTPMYNTGYKTRLGFSIDGFYDGSANIYTYDSDYFHKPTIDKQLALGFSGRAEFVMPYFTIGTGLGVNVLHKGGDLKAFYQIVTLKTEITRNSFLHIGYTLLDFHDPNFLMLGVGYRFNNKHPGIRFYKKKR